MRILAIDRHFWPDTTPYAHILRTLARHLAEQGHAVTVFTAQPSYNDIKLSLLPWHTRDEGVEIRRVRLLPERKRWRVIWLFNCCYFLLRAVLHAWTNRRYDLILGANTHPVLSGLALRLAQLCTGLPYILHSQDVHPEAAACAGMIAEGSFYRWLKTLDQQSYDRAQVVVAICADQKAYLRQRSKHGGSNIVEIPNPALDTAPTTTSALPPAYAEIVARNPAALRVLFAGNLGNFQALDPLASAAALLENQPDLQFVFVGEGLAKHRLQDYLRGLIGKSVFFLPYHPVDMAFAMMREAGLGVVSLNPGMYRIAFPSKTMMYLAAGCPLLAIVEPESELASLVRLNGWGIVANACEGASIAEAIREFQTTRSFWDAAARERIRQSGDEQFGRVRVLREWSRLLSSDAAAFRPAAAAVQRAA